MPDHLSSDGRKRWLSILARVPAARLEAYVAGLSDLPAFSVLKPAEAGMVMTRGRAGGTGQPFNLGEVSVSRCAIRMEGGVMGVGYVLGHDRRKAELVAILDALLQRADWRERVTAELIEPQATQQLAARNARAAKVAATKVSFFTLVRGE